MADMWKEVGYSRQTVHKQLKQLVAEGVVVKFGEPPDVFYRKLPPGQYGRTG